jgi:hypothetical protein
MSTTTKRRKGRRQWVVLLILVSSGVVIAIKCCSWILRQEVTTTLNNKPKNNNDANKYENDDDDNECCGIMCTTPPNACCLSCKHLSSPREHDLLMAMMEGLTVHLMDKHSPSSYNNEYNAWMQTRAWEGNSHIGNRPKQATYYYDWIRSIDNERRVQHVCEIGMNGGHSALIFLAALSKTTVSTTTSRIRRRHQQPDGHGANLGEVEQNNGDNTAKLTMFDRHEFDYSPSAVSYIEKLYPGRFELHKGDSTNTVPKWTLAMEEGESNKCDIFSVDGDHSYEGARIDILNAIKATRKGGKIILDDMNPDGPTRKAFDSVLSLGREGTSKEEKVVLTDPRCVEDVYIRVGYKDRINGTNAREMCVSWCSATVV